ncbi:MAG: hypothetical protein LBU94_04635, partial [Clostridiales bacterium]|nr:hypothetical protein [Clostridiales bacterium]
MSLIDFFNIKKRSTKRLLGIKMIHKNSVELYNGDILIMFRIRPSNISTLSKDMLSAVINCLFVVIKSLTHIELCAYDTAESYGANNEYLTNREAEEKNTAVKQMIWQEKTYIESRKTNTTTSKEFLIQLRFKASDTKQIESQTRHAEKILSDNSFFPMLLTKEQIKYSLAVYYQ